MKYSICQLEAIFCDEIRVENNGKKIFIGVYSGAMLVNEFPAVFPRLTVALNLLMSADRLPRNSVRFVLLQDDELLAEAEPPREFLEENLSKALSRRDNGGFNRLTVEFNLTPFQVSGPCKLKVRAYVDDVEIRTGGLRVESAEESSSTSNAGARE